MFKFLKKDSLGLGMGMGLVLPGALFGILYLVNEWVSKNLVDGREVLSLSSLGLIAIFLNMFLMRMYLIRWKLDKTGRGILVVTFILAILFIVLLFE